jgi:hypothetical protein
MALLMIVLLFCSSLAAILYKANLFSVILGVVFSTACFSEFYQRKGSSIESVGLLAVSSYAIVIILWAPVVSVRRSNERILNCMTHYSVEEPVSVSILGNRSYSAHLLSEGSETELSKPIDLRFVDYSDLPGQKIKNLLVRSSDSDVEIANYTLRAKLGNWYWLSFGPAKTIDCSTVPEAA